MAEVNESPQDAGSALQAVVDALGPLTDEQVCEVVLAVAGSRPGLVALRDVAAALAGIHEPVDVEGSAAATEVGTGVALPSVAAPGGPVVSSGGAVPLGGGVSPGALDPGFTADGVPTFEGVRSKIEGRYTVSVGASELDHESAEGRAVEEQWEARSKAAKDRLAQIRSMMRRD